MYIFQVNYYNIFFNQYVINKICNSKGVSNLKYNNNNYYFLSHHIRLYLIIEGKDDLADMFKILGVRPRLNSPDSFRNSFQPVFHDWCNKDRGICYPVYGMVHIKEPLLLIRKSSPCGGSGFPLTI